MTRERAFVYDLLTNDQQIVGTTFQDLDIHGPGLVFPVPGTSFACEDCEFAVPPGGTVESIIWEVPAEREFIGPIGLVDCTFRRCSFTGLGWVLSAYEADRFRQMVGTSHPSR